MKLKGLTTTFLVTTLFSGIVGLAPNSAWARGGGGGGGGSHSSGGHSSSVHVSGYTRSNGTYVAPYTRSAPSGGSSYRSSDDYGGSPGYSDGSNYKNSPEYNGNYNYNGSSGHNNISNKKNLFEDALNTAESATTIAQSAAAKDDWDLVISQLDSAITRLKQIPASSTNFAEAKAKIREYKGKLNDARKQIDLPPLTESEENLFQASNTTKTATDYTPPTPTSVTTPVSPPPTPISVPTSKAKPTSDSNSPNEILGIVLAVIIAAGLYRVWILLKASQPGT